MAVEFDPIACETKIEKEGKWFVAFPFFMEILAERQSEESLLLLVKIITNQQKEIIKAVDAKCFVSLVKFEEQFCQSLISQLKSKADFNEFKEKLFANFSTTKHATFEKIDKSFGRYNKHGSDLVIYHDRIFDRKTKTFLETNHDRSTYLYYNKNTNFYLLINNQLDGMGLVNSSRIGYKQEYEEIGNIDSMLEKLAALSIDKMLVYSFLGWVIGQFYLDEIKAAKEELLFPIFMIYGSSGQGKTELMSSLLAIYGAPINIMGFATATSFAMEHFLKKHLRTAVYYDEFRACDLRFDKKKAELLRTVPFAGVVPKGRADLSVVPFRAEAGLVLSGESPFEEQAETRRSIMFDFSDRALKIDDWKKANREWKAIAFQLFRYIAENDFSVKDYLEFSEENKKYLTKKNSEICFGAIAGIFGKEKAECIYSDCQDSLTEDINLTNADLFFRNVEEYIGTDQGTYAKKYVKVYSDRVFIAVASLIKEMGQKRFIEETFTSRDVIGQIKAKYGRANVTADRANMTDFASSSDAKRVRGIYIRKEVLKDTDQLQILIDLLK